MKYILLSVFFVAFTYQYNVNAQIISFEEKVKLFQSYEKYYNQGIKEFNLKMYADAFVSFKNALKTKDYVYAKGYEVNGFKFPALDTQLVNFAGSAGMLAKQDDAAIPYFQLIADQKLKGDDFKDVYPILVDYFTKKKDSVNRAKYLAIGMEVLPTNPYWAQSKLQEAGNDKGKRLAQFQELLKNDPTNYDLLVDYAVELFNYTYGKDKPEDYIKHQGKLTAALQDAIKSNPNSIYTNYIMTQHISNEISDLQAEYNSIKTHSNKSLIRKQEFINEIDNYNEKLYDYALTTFHLFERLESMTFNERSNYRNIINQLISYHTAKRNQEKTMSNF